MSFIETIPPRQARDETARTYAYLGRVLGGDGLVARIVQMFSLRAGSMRRMIRAWELTMWCGAEPRSHRELLAALVSRFNDCHY